MIKKPLPVLVIALTCLMAGNTPAATDEKTIKDATAGQELIVEQYKNNRPMGDVAGDVRPGAMEGVVENPSDVYLSDFIPVDNERTATQVLQATQSKIEDLSEYHEDPERLGEDARKIEERSDTTTAETNAYSLMREGMLQERPTLVDSNGNVAAFFDATIDALDPETILAKSKLFGDCKTTFKTVTGDTETFHFDERRSCQAVYKPSVESCTATRTTKIVENPTPQLVIVLNSLCPSTDPDCKKAPPPPATGTLNITAYLSNANPWYIETKTSTGSDVSITIQPVNLGIENNKFLGKFRFQSWSTNTVDFFTIQSPALNSLLSATVTLDNMRHAQMIVSVHKLENNTIKGCETFFDLTADGFCEGVMTCTDIAPNRCTEIDGFNICEGGENGWLLDLLPPWHSQKVVRGGLPELVPRICNSAVASAMVCDYTQGQGECFIDAAGNQRCVNGDGLSLGNRVLPFPYYDDCGNLESNDDCQLVDTDTCVTGSVGAFTNTCYVKDIGYECGTRGATFNTQSKTVESIDCNGEVRCMGKECSALLKENNRGINRANSVLTTYRYLQMDAECVDQESGGCIPMTANGEVKTCRIPVGTQDFDSRNCCDLPLDVASRTSHAEYMKLYTAANNIENDAQNAAKWAELEDEHERTRGKRTGGSAITAASEGEMHVQASTAKRDREVDDEDNSFINIGMQAERSSAALILQKTQEKEAQYIDPTRDDTSSDTNYTYKNFRSTFESEAGAAGVQISDYQEGRDARGLAMSREGTGLAQYTASGVEEHIRKSGDPDLADTIQESGGLMGLVAGEMGINTGDSVGYLWGEYGGNTSEGTLATYCKASEIELGYQRQARNCHYVGKYCSEVNATVGIQRKCVETVETYCCFNSAAVRIVAEKFKGGGGWGTARAPNCSGIPLETLAEAPVGGADMRELEAILSDSSMSPTHTINGNIGLGTAGPLAGAALQDIGPDGILPVRNRTEGLLRNNMKQMSLSTVALSDNAAHQYDPELIRWYDITTLGESVTARTIRELGPPVFVGGEYTPPEEGEPRPPGLRPLIPSDSSTECQHGEGDYTGWSELYQASFPSPRHPYVSNVPIHKDNFLAIDMGTIDTLATGAETALSFKEGASQVLYGSISKCPGDFDTPPECQKTWAPGGESIYWTTEGYKDETGQIGFCAMDLDERYYLNLKWEDVGGSQCSGDYCYLEVLTHLRITPPSLPGDE